LDLTSGEIEFFIDGVTKGTIADYQVSALLMAIFLNGMNETEQAQLTQAMLHSGSTLDFSAIQKPKADKHSTGGVGDKVSLPLAPLLAWAGSAQAAVRSKVGSSRCRPTSWVCGWARRAP